MKKQSKEWQEAADNAKDAGAKQYAERRAQAARQEEEKEESRLERWWRERGGK